VNLRGRFEAASDRREVLGSAAEARRRAYRHVGRFNAKYLPVLDRRKGVRVGEQFNYRLTETGTIHGSCREPMEPAAFERMLDRVRDWVREVGGRIYGGDVSIDPYRRGTELACDQCDVRAICRIDPWTHRYRALVQVRTASGKGEG
jgi:ATP-dependent helicase/nuclease subunit B